MKKLIVILEEEKDIYSVFYQFNKKVNIYK